MKTHHTSRGLYQANAESISIMFGETDGRYIVMCMDLMMTFFYQISYLPEFLAKSICVPINALAGNPMCKNIGPERVGNH